MTQLNQIYKCNVCGNMVEMVHASAGQLVCCGQPMELLTEKHQDEGVEKHLPIVESINDKIIIKVGSVEHPMIAEHYIEWVEVATTARTYHKTFTPGEKPFVEFCLNEEIISVRAYCNIHGLWSK